jgi:hypothetical protein
MLPANPGGISLCERTARNAAPNAINAPIISKLRDNLNKLQNVILFIDLNRSLQSTNNKQQEKRRGREMK